MKKVLKNYKSSLILLGAIIIGTIVGLVFKEKASVLSPFGDLFLNLLLVIIVPLIFLTLTTSIGKMKQPKRIGKVMISIVVAFIITSLIAVFVGVFSTFKTSLVDVSDGEQTIDFSDTESEETKRIGSFVIMMALSGEVNYYSENKEDITYTDIDGDEIFDIYSYTPEEGKINYGECQDTKLSGDVEYYKASEKVIDALKATGDDYYSGIVFKFSEPLGDLEIDYTKNAIGEEIDLTTSSNMEERRVEQEYLYDTFEEIFGSGGSGSTYLLKKFTDRAVNYYYLDFDKDEKVDVIVRFLPYYYVDTCYLSETCKDKTFKFNTTSGKKKVYKNISFKIPNKTFEFNMSKLAIDFTLNHSDTYRLTDEEKETYGYRKSLEMALNVNMEYCAKIGLSGVNVVKFNENRNVELDFDGDKKADVNIKFSEYDDQVVYFISETICNKTIELTFPDTIKGYKKITFKFPATLGYGWGEKVIDFKNDLGYLTSDSDFTNVMNFLSFTKAMNKKSDMFDLDGDGTTDITIYGSRDALVLPTESSNLLGKEYTISYTDEYLKEKGFESFN